MIVDIFAIRLKFCSIVFESDSSVFEFVESIVIVPLSLQEKMYLSYAGAYLGF